MNSVDRVAVTHCLWRGGNNGWLRESTLCSARRAMIAAAVVVAIFSPPAASGTGVKLDGARVNDAAACREVLREFEWFCKEFDSMAWVRRIGRAFWDGASLLVYRHDLDGDGTQDSIVKIEHVGSCSRGGPICDHFFLFGDQPETEHPHSYSIRAYGPPIVTGRDGTPGVLFEATTDTPETFYGIASVKGMTVIAPNKPIIY